MIDGGARPDQHEHAGLTHHQGHRAVRWESVSETHWTAFVGPAWVGSVSFVGSYIATDQYATVLGTFETLTEAQRAVTDPVRDDPDYLRRLHARRLHRRDRFRLIALAALVAAAVGVTILASVLLTHASV
jgi:hypothetical protein